MRGVVKVWFESRGFGYITSTPENGGKGRDWFVHATGVSGEGIFKTLREGAVVEFNLAPARDPNRPPIAVNVRALEDDRDQKE